MAVIYCLNYNVCYVAGFFLSFMDQYSVPSIIAVTMSSVFQPLWSTSPFSFLL